MSYRNLKEVEIETDEDDFNANSALQLNKEHNKKEKHKKKLIKLFESKKIYGDFIKKVKHNSKQSILEIGFNFYDYNISYSNTDDIDFLRDYLRKSLKKKVL